MSLRLLLAFVAYLVLSQGTADAYPNYISFGYKPCMTCHYNPMGGGPLTDYGRALAATEIADRLFWPKDKTDEEIGDKSAFLGEQMGPDWLRPSMSYRSLNLRRNADKKERKDEFIQMDLSSTLVAKFMERDRLIFVGSIGYAPKPLAQKDRDDDEVKLYRSREHYVGYRLMKELGIYAGLMDKAFGIRVPDHIAFSRTLTGLTMNDQSHGVMLHYIGEEFEAAVQPFIGNLVQDKDLRQKGVTATGEYTLNDTMRVGASALGSQSEFLKMQMYSAHGRIGIAKGHSVMAEVGQVERTPKDADAPIVKSQYAFTQTHVWARRGLWALLTLEGMRPDKSTETKTVRIGPGMQWLPVQRVEFRFDAYQTETTAPGTAKVKSLDLAAQTHIWL